MAGLPATPTLEAAPTGYNFLFWINSLCDNAMPIYAYRCAACGHSRDVLQKLSDAPLTTCPACGAEQFSKQVTAAGFQLKGSGWYVTDFRNKQGGSGGAAASPSSSSSGASSGEGHSSSGSSSPSTSSSSSGDGGGSSSSGGASPASACGGGCACH